MKIFVTIIFAFLLAGCGTFALQTNSKITQSVFLKDLQPVKTIFLSATNTTSDNSNIWMYTKLNLEEKGYVFTASPKEAKYILRINVLNKDGKLEQNEARAAATLGGAAGVMTGIASNSLKKGVVAGIVGATIGGAFAFITADGNVRMQVDVLISENLEDSVIEHKTRVIAEATKVRLTPEEGQPILEKMIGKQIAGIFL